MSQTVKCLLNHELWQSQPSSVRFCYCCSQVKRSVCASVLELSQWVLQASVSSDRAGATLGMYPTAGSQTSNWITDPDLKTQFSVIYRSNGVQRNRFRFH